MGYRIAIDIGGTFTDLFGIDDETGRVLLGKVSTTPDELSRGVLDSLARSSIRPQGVSYFVHGSTVVINAILERNGATTALVTTKGFRDVLEIQRGNRPDVYDFDYSKPTPFVPRHLRFEVKERLDSKGKVLRAPDAGEVAMVAKRLKQNGVASVAVCLINSYANPSNERRCMGLLRREMPDVPITASSSLSREWREYERTSTAVMSAYVKPIVEEYLDSMEDGLNRLGVRVTKNAMQSNGGIMSFSEIREAPLLTVESGPVAGAIGAARLGEILGESSIITLDIGGTTAKTTLIEEGRVRITDQYNVGRTTTSPGYPLLVPVVDIVEIGAGGGSIGWVDEGGSFRVGPRSAGASPGPACYGKGSEEPTVTDANLVLGRINPDYFLGGEMKLDVDKAESAIEKLGRTLGTGKIETALGILNVANNNMINALKLISVRRGYDPRDFTLMTYGGLGAGHAAILAKELRMRKIIVPVAPSHFSAWGMIVADMQKHFARTSTTRLEPSNMKFLESTLDEMREEGLRTYEKRGLNGRRVRFEEQLDMRYIGQEHTIRLQLARRRGLSFGQLRERFDTLHKFTHGFTLTEPVEVVNLRLIITVEARRPRLALLRKQRGARREKGHRRVWFDDGDAYDTTLYERRLLPPGIRVRGPAIIEEEASTTVLPPEQEMTVDRFGNLIMNTKPRG